MTDLRETDCTITHEGREYTANGAYVDDTQIVAYLGTATDRREYPTRDGRHFYLGAGSSGPLTDWHGNVIGRYIVISTWIVYAPGAYTSARIYQVYMMLADGRRYNGRGQGEGMYVRGKRAKTKGQKP